MINSSLHRELGRQRELELRREAELARRAAHVRRELPTFAMFTPALAGLEALKVLARRRPQPSV